MRSSFSGAFVALAVVAEPEPELQRSAVYDAYLFLVRNRAIAGIESTQPAKIGFFQLCGSKCGKQIASKVFCNLLGKQPITGKRTSQCRYYGSDRLRDTEWHPESRICAHPESRICARMLRFTGQER